MAALASIVGSLILAGAPDTVFVEVRFVGTFKEASRITVDVRGRLFVVDRGTHSVIAFTGGFERLTSVGGYGWDATSFDRPSSAVSDGLSLYVSDYGNHRVSRFDRAFTPLSSFVTRDSSYSPARFGYPMGVALSRQGDLYVLDGDNLRVVQFDSRSRYIRSFGGIESGRGRLRHPVEIDVTGSDDVLVLESDRVVQFDYAGNFVRDFGNGVIEDATGFDGSAGGVAVVSASSLWLFDDRHTLRHAANARDILSSSRLILTDVAVSGETLFLLTPERVGVFRIETSDR